METWKIYHCSDKSLKEPGDLGVSILSEFDFDSVLLKIECEIKNAKLSNSVLHEQYDFVDRIAYIVYDPLALVGTPKD